MTASHVVFLQGMPSPFFSRIARELMALGCKVTGINFCVGDSLFWHGPHTVNYRGRLSGWPAFIEAFFDKEGVTDIVLLGEQRNYHKQAIEIAKKCGIRVIVTDFGYLRPDWITLERDGMSSNSQFPRKAVEISSIASQSPKVDLTPKYRDNTFSMSLRVLLYNFSNVLFGWLYPHYCRSDKHPHPLIHYPCLGWRMLFAKAKHKEACAGLKPLLETKARYFFFPLQIDYDFQIIAYSPFENMEGAIRTILKSFAANAEKDVRLVVKVHPWDSGLKNWKKLIFRLAKEWDISERIHYFDGGSLDEMIAHSAGVITVNSTTGFKALQLGKPLIALGDAIYTIDGLTYQKGLDSFWVNASPPSAELVFDLINAMASTIQIRGVFFSEPGLSVAVREATQRIYNVEVGQLITSIKPLA